MGMKGVQCEVSVFVYTPATVQIRVRVYTSLSRVFDDKNRWAKIS
jgi:hypothetical protein